MAETRSTMGMELSARVPSRRTSLSVPDDTGVSARACVELKELFATSVHVLTLGLCWL
jgi:hypothetical protein